MQKSSRRKVDLVIISDVHLGTFGCQAKELVHYLSSIKPKRLIINGDFIDGWQFKKRYFPKPHMQVIKQIMSFVSKGTKVDYIIGNHDEVLRKFEGFELGKNFRLTNKLILDIDDKKAWIFHGDVFDVTMQYSKWLSKLGAVGYDLLILINVFVNFVSTRILGRKKLSISKSVKNGVKWAVAYVNQFENIAADIAIENKYDYVICGHIHKPQMRVIETSKGKVNYLNSGDWVEHMTALEYHKGKWSLYQHSDRDSSVKAKDIMKNLNGEAVKSTKELFGNLVEEFNTLKK